MTSEAGNGRQERGETPGAGGELFESGAAREGAADESAAQGLAAQLRATECVSVGARLAERGWRLWGASEIERLTKREQPCQGGAKNLHKLYNENKAFEFEFEFDKKGRPSQLWHFGTSPYRALA